MENAIYPFICIQKKTSNTVNINGFIHVIIPGPSEDGNPRCTEFAMLGRNDKHINAKSQREEKTMGRRPMRVLRAMKIKNVATNIEMSGIVTLSRIVEFIVVCFSANVELWHPSLRALKFKWLSDFQGRKWDCPAASGYGFERAC
jgi:hypothetical protein